MHTRPRVPSGATLPTYGINFIEYNNVQWGLIALALHVFFRIYEKFSNVFLGLALVLTKNFWAIYDLGLVAI